MKISINSYDKKMYTYIKQRKEILVCILLSVIIFYLNETGSPALIKDPSDFDSIFVVMPMKG